MKSRAFLNAILVFFTLLFFASGVIGQITLINEEFGLKIYPKKRGDTIVVNYLKGFPNCKMQLFSNEWNEEIKFDLIDKKGTVKVQGQFECGKDTLRKYTFSKVLGITDGKSYSLVGLIKYFYLLKSGTWTYFDANKKIVKKEQYEYEFD